MKDMRPVDATTKWLSVLALAIGLAVAGCGIGPAPTVAVQSPVDTVYAFFKALNTGDMRLAGAFLAPRSAVTLGWDAPPRDEFANLSCRPGSEFNSEIVDSATKAVLACEFDIREDWGGFSAGHHPWGVWLERQSPRPWLVHDWGMPIGPW